MDKSKDVKEQFILSRDAVGLANKAFFDPSMMGLLYFVRCHQDTEMMLILLTRAA